MKTTIINSIGKVKEDTINDFCFHSIMILRVKFVSFRYVTSKMDVARIVSTGYFYASV